VFVLLGKAYIAAAHPVVGALVLAGLACTTFIVFGVVRQPLMLLIGIRLQAVDALHFAVSKVLFDGALVFFSMACRHGACFGFKLFQCHG